MILENDHEDDDDNNEIYNGLYARKKIRHRNTRRVIILSVASVSLVIALITVGVLYHLKLGKSEEITTVLVQEEQFLTETEENRRVKRLDDRDNDFERKGDGPIENGNSGVQDDRLKNDKSKDNESMNDGSQNARSKDDRSMNDRSKNDRSKDNISKDNGSKDNKSNEDRSDKNQSNDESGNDTYYKPNNHKPKNDGEEDEQVNVREDGLQKSKIENKRKDHTKKIDDRQNKSPPSLNKNTKKEKDRKKKEEKDDQLNNNGPVKTHATEQGEEKDLLCGSSDLHCDANAYCKNDMCICKKGFIGDGFDVCKNISFSIHFKTRTTLNLPEIQPVIFPKTDELSVCLWFKPTELGNKHHSVFMYESTDIIHSHDDFMIRFNNDAIYVWMMDESERLKRYKLKLEWTHLCWTWRSSGEWRLYINGEQEARNGRKENLKTPFKESFPESEGSLLLGQDKDSGKVNDKHQMFLGEITQFYVYQKALDVDQIKSSYEENPPFQNIVVGWWRFANRPFGDDIAKTKYPF